MKDLTQVFKEYGRNNEEILKTDVLQNVQKNLELFNDSTRRIYEICIKLQQDMENQKDRYFKNKKIYEYAMSDEERNQFESQIKDLLFDLGKEIQLFQNLAQKNQSFMKSLNYQDQAHKELAISNLQKRLFDLNNYFKKFKIHRLKTSEKVGNLILVPKKQTEQKISNQQRKFYQQEIRPEIKERMEIEGGKLKIKYKQNQEDLLQISQSIENIVETIQQMSTKVHQQELQTDIILENAKQSYKNVEDGNKSLVSAHKYQKQIGKWWYMIFLTMTFILIFYDWLNS